MLVLDKSGSMWSYHSQLKEFARSLVRQFVLSETSTAIGLVEFAGASPSGPSPTEDAPWDDAQVLPLGG